MQDSPLIKEINNLPPIKRAIKLVGAVNMATQLGLTRAAIYAWSKKDRIPPDYLLRVEKLSGVSRFELAPEIYGVEQS